MAPKRERNAELSGSQDRHHGDRHHGDGACVVRLGRETVTGRGQVFCCAALGGTVVASHAEGWLQSAHILQCWVLQAACANHSAGMSGRAGGCHLFVCCEEASIPAPLHLHPA